MFTGLVNKLKVTAVLIAVTLSSLAQNALFIPPTLSGTNFNLNVKSDSTEFFTGHKTPTYGVNGNILAPTLILNKGDNVTLNVTNHLNTATTMHWHGFHLPAAADGGPHQIITPSNTWSPSFTIMNDAGTYWYHPHGDNKTDLQVSKGLAGIIIIKDSAEAALNLPRTYGADDFPLIVQTKCFDVLYQTAIATMFDTVPMVNATINPFLNAPAQVIRLRLLDGSSDRSYMFGFSNNMNFHLIATDGGLIDTPLTINRLRLSPGERAEILLDLSSMQGQTINLMNYGSEIPDGIIGALHVASGAAQIPDYNLNFLNGADFNLLQINVGPQLPNPVTSIPSSLVPLHPLDTNQIDRVRTIVFEPETPDSSKMAEGPFVMNGHHFSMMVTNDTVLLNDVEKWTLINNTLVAHPFHIHDVQFFVTDINGGSIPDNQHGQKDVVLVMPGDTLSFITKFEDFADTIPYMYHCHLLHHEDDGMMGSFIVLDTSSISIQELLTRGVNHYYPNPITEGELTIELENKESEKIQYRFINALGQQLLAGEQTTAEGRFYMKTSHLPSGFYFVQLKQKNNSTNLKIIID